MFPISRYGKKLILNFILKSSLYFNMKKFLVLILFFTVSEFCFSQTSLPISITLSNDYNFYKHFKLFVITKSDTALKINSLSYPISEKSYDDTLEPYDYYNRFEIFYSRDTINWEKETLEFDLNGKEKELYIDVIFHMGKAPPRYVTIKRSYPPGNIEITSLWSGLIGDSPKYTLINNSNLTFYSAYNMFWGNTYKFIDNEWIFESVGGICGMWREVDEPNFKPGDTIISTGANFIGEDYAVQEKGKYKYVVHLGTGKNSFEWGRSGNPPYKNIYDIYYLEKEFEITSDSIHYPRSTYEKKEIRGIYNIISKTAKEIMK